MRYRTVGRIMAFVGAAVLVLAGCGPDESASTSESTSTVTVTASTDPATPSPEHVIDVDPADYEIDASPGSYRWTYAQSPVFHECGMMRSLNGYPAYVSCSAPFPQDLPDITNGTFVGPPNSVQLTEDAVQATITEGGPPGAQPLAPNHRITMGDLSCTALPDDGIDCTGPTAGFRVEGDVVTQRGNELEPSRPASTSTPAQDGAPMDHYTDETTPVPPGTMCGAATGRMVVQVVSGTISCADALDLMEGYRSYPDEGRYGNAKIMEYEGWSCSTATAALATERGYGARCTRGDIELIAPV